MHAAQKPGAKRPCDGMYTYGTWGTYGTEAACGLEMMRNGHGEFGGISGDTLSWEGVCRHYYIIFEINLHTPVRNARTQRRGYIFKKYKLALKINSASISDATVTRTNDAVH